MVRPGGKAKPPGPKKGVQAPVKSAPLEPPIMDRDRVVEKFGQGVVVKKEWAENPKSPLANHIGNSMPIKYECQTGTVGGKKIYR
jgi:hypothetical protein